MPRDSSGNYSLPPGNPVIDGTVIDVNWANPTMSDVAVQLNNLLTRDGLLGATAPIKFNDGTLALPGITWASETTMGLYRPTANTMAAAVQGTVRQVWNNTGTIVTGTFGLNGSLTTSLLTINGTAVLPAYSFANDIHSGVYLNAVNQLAFATNGTFAGMFDVTGALGVGLAPSSGFKLDVLGAIRSFGGEATAAGVGLRLLNSTATGGGSVTALAGGGAGVRLSADGGPLSFSAGGSERMVIDTVGRVGIGVNSPQANLHISGAAVSMRVGGSGASDWAHYGNDASGAYIYTPGATTIRFLTNNVQRMMIDASGRVGIGRTPTSFPFEVQGSMASVDGELVMSSSTGGGDLRLGYQSFTTNASWNLWTASNVPLTLGAGAGERMRINFDGMVVINRPSGAVIADGRLQVHEAAKVPNIAFVKIGLQGWYVGGDKTGGTNRFDISANGGPVLSIDPSAGKVGLNNQSFTNYINVGYQGDGLLKEMAFFGPYGDNNFANLYIGESTGNGGSKIDLNAHTSGTTLAGWRIRHDSDASATDLVFYHALSAGSRAAQSWVERFRHTSDGRVLSSTPGTTTVQIGLDPGGVGTTIPIGAFVIGQAVGVNWGTTACLGVVALNASNTLVMGGWTSSVTINYGNWRLIQRIEPIANNHVMCCRVS